MHPKSSWTVKGEAIHQELSTLVDLRAEETAALKSLHAEAEKVASEFAVAFYERLLAHPNTAEYFAGIDMDRMRGGTARWFADLFTGDYGPEYVRRRLHIGRVHVDIGLPVRYPLAMFDLVLEYAERVAAGTPATLGALRKVLAIDFAIFNQSYEDSQVGHLAEIVGGELLARKTLME